MDHQNTRRQEEVLQFSCWRQLLDFLDLVLIRWWKLHFSDRIWMVSVLFAFLGLVQHLVDSLRHWIICQKLAWERLKRILDCRELSSAWKGQAICNWPGKERPRYSDIPTAFILPYLYSFVNHMHNTVYGRLLAFLLLNSSSTIDVLAKLKSP